MIVTSFVGASPSSARTATILIVGVGLRKLTNRAVDSLCVSFGCLGCCYRSTITLTRLQSLSTGFVSRVSVTLCSLYRDDGGRYLSISFDLDGSALYNYNTI